MDNKPAICSAVAFIGGSHGLRRRHGRAQTESAKKRASAWSSIPVLLFTFLDLVTVLYGGCGVRQGKDCTKRGRVGGPEQRKEAGWQRRKACGDRRPMTESDGGRERELTEHGAAERRRLGEMSKNKICERPSERCGKSCAPFPFHLRPLPMLSFRP